MNLVVQAAGLSFSQVDELGPLLKPESIRPLRDGAFLLAKPSLNNPIDAWCDAHRADHAWIERRRSFADLELLAMDMDSTLITIECIDELGDLAGKKDEVAAITARAMRGEIDYPESLRRRVALLAGLPATALEEVYQQRLRLTPGAHELLETCERHGVKLLLVSGGFTFFTERLKQRLGIDYTISNTLEIQVGVLTGKVLGNIVDADAKAQKFREVCAELGAQKYQTVAIGDGANDLKMMKEAGVSIAFHAKPVVRAQADYALTWSGLDGVLNLFD